MTVSHIIPFFNHLSLLKLSTIFEDADG